MTNDDHGPEGPGFGPDGPFGEDGPFGPKGPYGRDGPFGPRGPFGRDGLFGRNGPFGRGGGGGGGGGSGRRRGRMFGPGELRLALLKLLADEPRHGYELIKAIEELTGGSYAPSPGAVYPTLQLLADEGAIAERPDDDSPRKAYAATSQGTGELAERQEEVDTLMARLAGLAEDQSSSPNRQLHRAMANLRNALRMQRHGGELAGELAGDRLHAIVDLIDETARRIERM